MPRLLAELHARGVRYLSGARDPVHEAEVAAHPLSARDLLLGLAAAPEPRLRDAVIALLILHPDLAAAFPPDPTQQSASSGITNEPTEELRVLGLAAMYLQQMWRSKLDQTLGRRTLSLPYWRARGLPPPTPDTADLGLRALAAHERQRRNVPYNFESAWQDQIDQLLAQEWLARKPRHEGHRVGTLASEPIVVSSASSAPNVHARGLPHTPKGAGAMSMRQEADRAAIERFLRRLGQDTRQPARIYLVGGTTMVYEGFRARTLDIYVLVESDDPAAVSEVLEAIRRLKDQLSLNVELASPGDFIPLPTGWRERSIWLGRYGPLDAFYFDLISVALSKIERGTERDFADVDALIRSGRIAVATLDAAFAEILPRVATEGIGSMDPDRFASQYAFFTSRLAGNEGGSG